MRWLPAPLRILVQAGLRFGRHQQSVACGHLAYSLMLAMMPFLIFATALTGYVVGPEGTDTALATLFDAFPDHVARTLQPVVIEVTSRPSDGILTVAALGATWAASNGIEAVRVGLDRAYEYDISRHFLINRLISILVVIIGFVTFVTLGVLVIFAPLLLHLLETQLYVAVPAGADVARHLAGFVLLSWFLWLLHRLLPARKMRGLRLWPGILLSVGLWFVMASGLSIYLTNFAQYSVTYGTLAGVIVTLLFLYLTGAVFMLGAEVNSVVNAARIRQKVAPVPDRFEGPHTPMRMTPAADED